MSTMQKISVKSKEDLKAKLIEIHELGKEPLHINKNNDGGFDIQYDSPKIIKKPKPTAEEIELESLKIKVKDESATLKEFLRYVAIRDGL